MTTVPTAVQTTGATRTPQDADLLEALHALQRMTATEAAIAGVRSLQARDDALKTELRENRRKAQERERMLAAAVAEVGGAASPISPAVGRAIAVAKAQLDTSSTFAGALLGDLALEAVLLERARYTRRLASRAGRTELVRLCDRLELAHSETIEWLRARLDELADTGRSRLRPLPTQVALSALRRAAAAPLMAVAQARRKREQAPADAYPAEATTAAPSTADLR